MSTDYNFDLETQQIRGMVEGKECLKRWIQRAVMIERNAYPQYTSDFGVELEHLKGKSYDFAILNIEKTIREALLIHEDIENVYDFTYGRVPGQKDAVFVSFKVNSIYGAIEQQTKVQL